MLDLVRGPKDRFSHNAAYLYFAVFKDPGVWEMLEQFGNTASTSVSIGFMKNR